MRFWKKRYHIILIEKNINTLRYRVDVNDDDGYIIVYQPYGTAADIADNTTEIATDEFQ